MLSRTSVIRTCSRWRPNASTTSPMSWWVIGRGSETRCCSTVIALASAIPIHTGSSRWSPLASCSSSTGRRAPASTPTAMTRISLTGVHPLHDPPGHTWVPHQPYAGLGSPPTLILRCQGQPRRRPAQIWARSAGLPDRRDLCEGRTRVVDGLIIYVGLLSLLLSLKTGLRGRLGPHVFARRCHV